MATSSNDQDIFRRSSSRYVHPSANRQSMSTKLQTKTQHSKHKTNDSYYSTFKQQQNPTLFTGQSSSRKYFNDNESTYSNLHDDYWKSIMNDAVYFKGLDPLFKNFISIIYKNPETSKLSSINISKAGEVIIDSMSLERTSRYHPAIENLPPNLRRSNVRRALAVSTLRYFTSINDKCIELMIKSSKLPLNFDWDETMAGELATKMQMITSKPPSEIGNYLLSLGFTKDYKPTTSHVVDVVYNNSSDEVVEMNNELAFLIGEQLEHLFDPLTEYSPEPTEKAYKPPSSNDTTAVIDDVLTKSICNELITVQTNFTVSLVQFLQRFIIPLRVKVLQGNIPDYNASRLNQVFPPTIDEVTRINCIFLDMLKLALPYGSFEVLKACGTTIPYFYKAYMRHEAATKTFSTKYEAFTNDTSYIKNNPEIFSRYDRRAIESTIYSSLNLPKIQLILDRLMQTQKFPDHLAKQAEKYYQSCTQTISSFANDTLKPYNSRIFTPTGKILTELASGWPVELQYGWLNRRVVALFDAQNMLTPGIMNQSVIIMFSDHILFLDVIDEEYYLDSSRKDSASIIVHKPSVADILMHSLVNEVPFSNLPKLKVTKWCKIKETVANQYNFNNKPFVQFMTEDQLLVYKIDKYSGSYVNEVLSKSKILNKSQPFHLFKKITGNSSITSPISTPTGIEANSHDGSTSIYYTAHDLDSYKNEEMKAPFVISLNSKFKKSSLDDFNAFGLLTLNFTNADEVQVQGATRCSNSDVYYVVKKPDLTLHLAETIDTLMSRYFTLENPMIDSKLLKFREGLVSNVVECMNVSDDAIQHELITLRIKKDQLDRETKLQDALRRDQYSGDGKRSRSASLDMLTNQENNGNRVSSTKITKKDQLEFGSDKKKHTTPEKKAKRKSGFLKFFSKKSPKEEELQDKSDSPTSHKPRKRLSRLFLGGHTVELPAGSKNPLEVKKDRNHVDTVVLSKSDTQVNNIANTTGNSSSLIVNSRFEFPLNDTPETEIERVSAAATPVISTNSIRSKPKQQNLNDRGNIASNNSSTDQLTKSTSVATATTTATPISCKVKNGEEFGDRELTEVFDEMNFEDIDYDVSQATSGELFNDEPEQPVIVKKTVGKYPSTVASPVLKKVESGLDSSPKVANNLSFDKNAPTIADPTGDFIEKVSVIPVENKEQDQIVSHEKEVNTSSIGNISEHGFIPTIKSVDDQIEPSVSSIRVIIPPATATVKSPQVLHTEQPSELENTTAPIPPAHTVTFSNSKDSIPNSIARQSSYRSSSRSMEKVSIKARPYSYSGPSSSSMPYSTTPSVHQGPFLPDNTVQKTPFSAPGSRTLTPLTPQFSTMGSENDTIKAPLQDNNSKYSLGKPTGSRNVTPPSPLIPQSPQFSVGRISPRVSTFGNSSIVQDHNNKLPVPEEIAELEENEKENNKDNSSSLANQAKNKSPFFNHHSHPFSSVLNSNGIRQNSENGSVKSPNSDGSCSKSFLVDNYYSKFKRERLVQEDALKKNGITAIPESESHQVLAVKGLLYSPSIAKQLKNLVRETKIEGNNWTTFVSREPTLAHLPTIPAPSDSPVFGNKQTSPALSNTSTPFASDTASSINATPKLGTARLEFYKSLNPPKEINEGTSVESSPASSQHTFRSPYQKSSSEFEKSLPKPVDQSIVDRETKKMDNDTINQSPPKFVNHFKLRETSALVLLADTEDLSSTNDEIKEEKGDEIEELGSMNDNTEILQEGDSTFKEPDDDGFLSGDDEDSEDGINDDQARAGDATRYPSPKEHINLKSKKPEDTTLCSALEDYEDQELLVDIIDGKRILSQHSINSLLLDDSYAYLGDFLAGDVTLDENARADKRRNLDSQERRKKEDVDLDAMYANNLKDSSLWYLAGLVGGNGDDLK